MMDGAPTLVQGGGEPTGSLALRICESTDERFDLDKGVPLRWLCPVCECCVETSFFACLSRRFRGERGSLCRYKGRSLNTPTFVYFSTSRIAPPVYLDGELETPIEGLRPSGIHYTAG